MKTKTLDNSKQIKLGALLSYLQMGLGFVIGLFYTPMLLRLLGQSEFGLYNTILSSILMFSVLSLGFNSSYTRFFIRYKSCNDSDAISKLNGLYLFIFSIIGLVALCGCLFLTNNLELIFKDGLTFEEYTSAKKMMYLFTIGTTIAFPLSVFTNIITANEKFVFLRLLGILTKIFNPILSLPFLLLGYKAFTLVSVSLFLQVITGCLSIYYSLFVLKCKFIFHGFSWTIIKEIFSFTIFIAINMIVDQINWNIDKVIIGRFFGTISVAIYSVGGDLNSHFISFSTSICDVFTPKVHKIYNDRTKDKQTIKTELSDLFIKVGRIQFIILALIASGLIIFGREFISFWAGPGYSNSYIVALFLIVPATIPFIQNIGIEIQRAMNKHQFRSVCYAIMAILNLIISIFLCKRYGETGAAVGTSVSILIANGLIMNVYYYKKCNIDIPSFWKNILKMSFGLIIPVATAIIVKHFCNFDTIPKLIIGIIAYSVLYFISMWIVSMNKFEKNLLISTVNKLGGKA